MSRTEEFGLTPLTKASSIEFPAGTSKPLVKYEKPETMSGYYEKLKANIDNSNFEVVDSIDEDGLYIGKRAIVGAQGQAQILNQAGTVFYHVLLYIKSGEKLWSLDYGPEGSSDVTNNVMEAVACAPVLHKDPPQPDSNYPLLKIKAEHLPIQDSIIKQAITFAQTRRYHAVYNNCIKNTDFFCRLLTKGTVRNAPLIYDALAGKVPKQDHPMLLMFLLMTNLSWFNLCDGSELTAEFLGLQAGDLDLSSMKSLDLPTNLISSQADVRKTDNQIDFDALLKSMSGRENPIPHEYTKSFRERLE